MSYLKMVSNWLTDYLQNCRTLKEKQIRYHELENINPDTIDMSREKLSGTNKIYSSVENKAIALAELNKDIKQLQSKKDFLDFSFTKLSNIEKQVIGHRYISPELLTWSDISKRVNRSERQCLNIRDRAIEKIERDLK